jgi:FkbM family methyltransferase
MQVYPFFMFSRSEFNMIKRFKGHVVYLTNKYYLKRMRKYLTKTNLSHEKLGTKYGIGIIPSNLLNSQSICYCAGAGEDISFDLELAKKYKCKVFIFDPTPRSKTHYEELVHRTNNGETMLIGHSNVPLYYSISAETLKLSSFYPFGLWSEDKTLNFFSPPKGPKNVSHSFVNLFKTTDSIEVECKSVRNIMSMLGHQKINLLKLDIVGSEYEVVDSLISDNICPEIILIEFDEGSIASCFKHADHGYFSRITKTIEKLLAAGYILTMIDDWNVTFVRESALPEYQNTRNTFTGKIVSTDMETPA